jgi:hypothetical protein
MNLETNMAAIGKRYSAAFDYEVSDDEVASLVFVTCFQLRSNHKHVSCLIFILWIFCNLRHCGEYYEQYVLSV